MEWIKKTFFWFFKWKPTPMVFTWWKKKLNKQFFSPGTKSRSRKWNQKLFIKQNCMRNRPRKCWGVVSKKLLLVWFRAECDKVFPLKTRPLQKKCVKKMLVYIMLEKFIYILVCIDVFEILVKCLLFFCVAKSFFRVPVLHMPMHLAHNERYVPTWHYQYT